MIYSEIVCLAKSRKLSGLCVAGKGKESPHAWLRPVSDRPTEEISWHERHYEDGRDVELLDVVSLPLVESKHKPNQPENWLINADEYWVKVGEFDARLLHTICDEESPLWENGYSSYHGINDYVPYEIALAGTDSLRLIWVDSLVMQVHEKGRAFGNPKRAVRAQFEYDGETYGLGVTDPLVTELYLSKSDGYYQLDGRYLTISLADPFHDNCYKLVAAIFGGG